MVPGGVARLDVPIAAQYADDSKPEWPDWWPYGPEFPDWHVWRGVTGILYARRPQSSPPRVLRSWAATGEAEGETSEAAARAKKNLAAAVAELRDEILFRGCIPWERVLASREGGQPARPSSSPPGDGRAGSHRLRLLTS